MSSRKRRRLTYVLLLSPLFLVLLAQIRLLVFQSQDSVGVVVVGRSRNSEAAAASAPVPAVGELPLVSKWADPAPVPVVIINQTLIDCTATGTLRDDCLGELFSSLARVWPRKHVRNWCRHPNGKTITNTSTTSGGDSGGVEGLLLVKVPKSASSTLAGMVLHFSHLYDDDNDNGNNHHCHVEWEHTEAHHSYANRSWSSSFLLAPIRWPATRALSDVYFHRVSLQQRARGTTKNPQDGFIINRLGELNDNFILRYTALREWNTLSVHDHVQVVLQEYDFLLVVERLVESIVVLAHLTNTSWLDWMTMSAKTSGSWYRSGNRCMQLVKPVETPPINEYFSGNEWMSRHAGDLILYHVANRSLDRSIDAIGRDSVQQQVQQVQSFQKFIERACSNETFFPCSSEGIVQLDKSQGSCYTRDFGCGYQCIRRISKS